MVTTRPTATAAAQAATRVTVTIGNCQGCGACLLTCPEHAIRPAGRALRVIGGWCTGCGECIEVCPVDAITEAAAPQWRDSQ